VGHALDDVRVAGAARNPPKPFSFLVVCRVVVSGTPIFARAFPSSAALRSQPLFPAARQGRCYVQAKSVVFGVPGQTRPATLDGGRQGFDAVIDHIPIDYRTLGSSFGAARIAYRIGHICRGNCKDYAKYDPEKHAHSSPFFVESVPPRLGVIPPRRGRTLAFLRFRSSAVVIFERGDSVDKCRFAGIADRRKEGWADVRERKRHCRVHCRLVAPTTAKNLGMPLQGNLAKAMPDVVAEPRGPEGGNSLRRPGSRSPLMRG
jgi:hypothetical protein